MLRERGVPSGLGIGLAGNAGKISVIPYDYFLFYLRKKLDILRYMGIMEILGNIQPRPAAAVPA